MLEASHKEALFASAWEVETFEKLGAAAGSRKAEDTRLVAKMDILHYF
jgi:hypothetical protein